MNNQRRVITASTLLVLSLPTSPGAFNASKTGATATALAQRAALAFDSKDNLVGRMDVADQTGPNEALVAALATLTLTAFAPASATALSPNVIKAIFSSTSAMCGATILLNVQGFKAIPIAEGDRSGSWVSFGFRKSTESVSLSASVITNIFYRSPSVRDTELPIFLFFTNSQQFGNTTVDGFALLFCPAKQTAYMRVIAERCCTSLTIAGLIPVIADMDAGCFTRCVQLINGLPARLEEEAVHFSDVLAACSQGLIPPRDVKVSRRGSVPLGSGPSFRSLVSLSQSYKEAKSLANGQLPTRLRMPQATVAAAQQPTCSKVSSVSNHSQYGQSKGQVTSEPGTTTEGCLNGPAGLLMELLTLTAPPSEVATSPTVVKQADIEFLTHVLQDTPPPPGTFSTDVSYVQNTPARQPPPPVRSYVQELLKASIKAQNTHGLTPDSGAYVQQYETTAAFPDAVGKGIHNNMRAVALMDQNCESYDSSPGTWYPGNSNNPSPLITAENPAYTVHAPLPVATNLVEVVPRLRALVERELVSYLDLPQLYAATYGHRLSPAAFGFPDLKAFLFASSFLSLCWIYHGIHPTAANSGLAIDPRESKRPLSIPRENPKIVPMSALYVVPRRIDVEHVAYGVVVALVAHFVWTNEGSWAPINSKNDSLSTVGMPISVLVCVWDYNWGAMCTMRRMVLRAGYLDIKEYLETFLEFVIDSTTSPTPNDAVVFLRKGVQVPLIPEMIPDPTSPSSIDSCSFRFPPMNELRGLMRKTANQRFDGVSATLSKKVPPSIPQQVPPIPRPGPPPKTDQPAEVLREVVLQMLFELVTTCCEWQKLRWELDEDFVEMDNIENLDPNGHPGDNIEDEYPTEVASKIDGDLRFAGNSPEASPPLRASIFARSCTTPPGNLISRRDELLPEKPQIGEGGDGIRLEELGNSLNVAAAPAGRVAKKGKEKQEIKQRKRMTLREFRRVRRTLLSGGESGASSGDGYEGDSNDPQAAAIALIKKLKTCSNAEYWNKKRHEFRDKHIGVFVSSIKLEWDKYFEHLLPLSCIMDRLGVKKLKYLLSDVPNLILAGDGGFMKVLTAAHARQLCTTFPPLGLDASGRRQCLSFITRRSNASRFQVDAYLVAQSYASGETTHGGGLICSCFDEPTEIPRSKSAFYRKLNATNSARYPRPLIIQINGTETVDEQLNRNRRRIGAAPAVSIWDLPTPCARQILGKMLSDLVILVAQRQRGDYQRKLPSNGGAKALGADNETQFDKQDPNRDNPRAINIVSDDEEESRNDPSSTSSGELLWEKHTMTPESQECVRQFRRIGVTGLSLGDLPSRWNSSFVKFSPFCSLLKKAGFEGLRSSKFYSFICDLNRIIAYRSAADGGRSIALFPADIKLLDDPEMQRPPGLTLGGWLRRKTVSYLKEGVYQRRFTVGDLSDAGETGAVVTSGKGEPPSFHRRSSTGSVRASSIAPCNALSEDNFDNPGCDRTGVTESACVEVYQTRLTGFPRR